MTEIPLTQGKVAMIDDVDLPLIAGRTWHAVHVRQKSGELWYAVSSATATRPRLEMHRVILNASIGFSVDHREGDGLNNRRSNLRPATKAQQTMNTRPRLYEGKASPFKGVVWQPDPRMIDGGSWCALITVNGRVIHRNAPSQEAAARFYNDLALEHFGEYARINDLAGLEIDTATRQQRIHEALRKQRERVAMQPGSAAEVAALLSVSEGFVRAVRRALLRGHGLKTTPTPRKRQV